MAVEIKSPIEQLGSFNVRQVAGNLDDEAQRNLTVQMEYLRAKNNKDLADSEARLRKELQGQQIGAQAQAQDKEIAAQQQAQEAAFAQQQAMAQQNEAAAQRAFERVQKAKLAEQQLQAQLLQVRGEQAKPVREQLKAARAVSDQEGAKVAAAEIVKNAIEQKDIPAYMARLEDMTTQQVEGLRKMREDGRFAARLALDDMEQNREVAGHPDQFWGPYLDRAATRMGVKGGTLKDLMYFLMSASRAPTQGEVSPEGMKNIRQGVVEKLGQLQKEGASLEQVQEFVHTIANVSTLLARSMQASGQQLKEAGADRGDMDLRARQNLEPRLSVAATIDDVFDAALGDAEVGGIGVIKEKQLGEALALAKAFLAGGGDFEGLKAKFAEGGTSAAESKVLGLVEKGGGEGLGGGFPDLLKRRGEATKTLKESQARKTKAVQELEALKDDLLFLPNDPRVLQKEVDILSGAQGQ